MAALLVESAELLWPGPPSTTTDKGKRCAKSTPGLQAVQLLSYVQGLVSGRVQIEHIAALR